jgi:hypothetical protein
MNTSIGKNLFTSFIDLIGKYTNRFLNNRNLINELIFVKRIHTTGFFFFLHDQKGSKKSRLMINCLKFKLNLTRNPSARINFD